MWSTPIIWVGTPKTHIIYVGSDLNTFLGRNPMVKLPVIPGHEVGAVIESVGEGVPESLKPGMIVTLNPYTNCGTCASCRNDRVNACEHNETLGVQRNGVMAEYAVLPWQKIIPAESISARDCALIEPMSVGFHAVSRGSVQDGEYVMVIGCGMVGMGAVVRAALRGAIVIAVDVDDEKLALAKESGAAYTINSMSENVHARMQEITSGYGADVVIEKEPLHDFSGVTSRSIHHSKYSSTAALKSLRSSSRLCPSYAVRPCTPTTFPYKQSSSLEYSTVPK